MPIATAQTNPVRRHRRCVGALLACLMTFGVELLAADGQPQALLKRLAAIESELAAQQPATPLQCRTPHLAFILGGVFQGVTNVYSDDRTRYLAVQLLVVNTSTEPQTLDVKGIRLRSGDQRLNWQDRPAGIDGYSFQADRDHIAIREVQPPDALAIPAGGSASTWLLFAGLEQGSFVPELKLELPTDPIPRVLDINLYQRALLQLRTERVGPSDCLALVTMGGPLNTVNAGSLAAELDRLATGGTHRVVVSLGSAAPVPNQFVLDWLKQARQPNPYLHQFKHMPVFPVTLQELHLVLEKQTGTADVHRLPVEAISAALRTALESVPLDDIVRSLRSPQAGVRAAALRYGAARLREEHLPLVLALTSDPEAAVRLSAINALGGFAAPQVTATLVELAGSADIPTSAAAVGSLAASRYPAGHAALGRLVAKGLPLPPQELVEVLAGHPRPEWREAVLQLTMSMDSKVQQSAMQALARLGHSQLMSVLVQGLQSSEARVREEAFSRLSELGTREADEVAIEHALERLRTEPPSASIQQFLIRVRDQRAVPLLVRHLDGPEGIRRNVIELLSQIGDHAVVGEIVARYPRFKVSEQVVALQALQTLESPLGRPLAIAALQSDDAALVQRGVGYLQTDPGDDVVAAMAQALTAAQSRPAGAASIGFLCNGLGEIGTPAAREALLAARRSTDESTRRQAQQGLLVLWNQSPAREVVAQGQVELARAAELARRKPQDAALLPDAPESAADREELRRQLLNAVERSFRVAEKIDPQFPELYLLRGLLRVQQQQPDAAVTDFRRAIHLNDELTDAYVELGQALYNLERFDESLAPLEYAYEHDPDSRRHQWLSSRALALIRLKRLEEGIDLIRAAADKFPADPVFEYNQACVYGRAVELLRSDPQVLPEDPRLAVFTEEAVRLLQECFSHDVAAATGEVDMRTFMRNDPDLKSLHAAPAFRKLAELDLAPAQRTPLQSPAPDQGDRPL